MSAAEDPASITASPEVVDQVALARLYGEQLFQLPQDLYIPPQALEVFLEAFEGPLDLLLYLIRRQNFNILDIPLAELTRQYLDYVEQIRTHNLELAAEYLLMAAMLIEIKSRMLLPPRKTDDGREPEYPRAELVRRLLEYEQMKLAAARLDALPLLGRDFLRVQVFVDTTNGFVLTGATSGTAGAAGAGSASFPLSIPNDPFLDNLYVYAQAAAFDAGSVGGTLLASAGLRFRVCLN